VPAVGDRGGVLVLQVARSTASALRGWPGEPQKPVEIRWNGIGVVWGWSPPMTSHHHVSAKCAGGHPRKRPGSTPNPTFGSEIAIDTQGIRRQTPDAIHNAKRLGSFHPYVYLKRDKKRGVPERGSRDKHTGMAGPRSVPGALSS
jgi:hypothetical protein